MSTPPIDKLEIIVGNFPADATLIQHNGVHTLFMRPQTFGNAVRHVRNLVPGITVEAAERLVREQCPEFKDLDDLLGLSDPQPPSVERPASPRASEEPESPRPRRLHRAALVAALLPALAASWALGRYTNIVDTHPSGTVASKPDAAPDSSSTPSAPFEQPRFTHFAGAGDIDCKQMNPLEAECTDADGVVMMSKAATGPDSTIFTFSYGTEQIGLRIFADTEYAQTWARQDGTRGVYDNLTTYGRYALWGTDVKRIREYVRLLKEADRHNRPTAMGANAPLPPRLAALALGTLGLDPSQVHTLLATPAAPMPGGTPTLMAARLVLGLDAAPPTTGRTGSGDDIVAIAAGIEPQPTDPPVPADPRPEPDPAPGADGNDASPAPSPEPSGDTTAPGSAPSGPPTPSTSTTEPTNPTSEKPTQSPSTSAPQAPADSAPADTAPEDSAPEDSAPADSAPADTTPEDSTPTDQQTASETPPPPDGASVEPPAEPPHEAPGPGDEGSSPETTPAPPVEEEPEHEGLSVDAMPAAWAAAS